MNELKDNNPLAISWHDSNRVPFLNLTNILDYFCDRTNPFYDRQCNNEVIRMQRLDPEQLNNMVGLEYILLHAQEPILYVIRKQYRQSPQHVVPQADYYILAGTVYQAPDLASVINSRLLTVLYNLQTSFEEAQTYMRYHPTKDYSWDFGKDRPGQQQADKQKQQQREAQKAKEREDLASTFQRRRVDMLLAELAKKFAPRPAAAPKEGEGKAAGDAAAADKTGDKDGPSGTAVDAAGPGAVKTTAKSDQPASKKARLAL